jgi:hypothetical protein
MNFLGQSSLLDIFRRYEFKVKDTIEDIFTEDLNDDGLFDLLVLTKAKNDKLLNIYIQKNEGFSQNPDQRMTLNKQVIIFDCGDVDSAYKGKEIVCLTSDAVFYYYLINGLYQEETRELMKVNSIFLSVSLECPVRSQFIFQTANKKSTMLLIPDAQGMNIFWQGQLNRSHKISLKPVFTTSSYSRRHREDSDFEIFSQKIIARVPMVFLKDFNGDKVKDLVSINKDEVEVFFMNQDGTFSLNPDFNIGLEVLTEEEKEKILRPGFNVKAEDLNGDGLIDVVATKTTLKSNSSLTKLYIYLNKVGKIESTPDQIVIFDNSLGTPKFFDLNNDGSKDLIVREAKIGLYEILKILITQKLNYKESIYLRKNDKYPANADFKLKAQTLFDLEKSTRSVEGEFFYFEGDYNGDGVKDLLKTDSRKKKIIIYLGDLKKKQIYALEPNLEIKESLIPIDLIINNLNGDDKSDIIFDYRRNKEQKIVLYLSK